jgi:hypothetical protein
MRRFLLTSFVTFAPLHCIAQVTASASLGIDNTSIDCLETASPLGTNTILSCRKDRPSSAVRLGYIFSNAFGFEFASFDFGRATARTFNEYAKDYYGLTAGKDSYAYNEDKLRTKTFSLALLRNIALTEDISTALKVGWAKSNTELTLCPVLRVADAAKYCHPATTQRRSSLYIGSSLSYRFSGFLSATLSIDYVPTGQVEVPGSTLAGYSRTRSAIATAGIQWKL